MAKAVKHYGKRWWTQEWLLLLELQDSARMERAQAYAAGSRVLGLKVRNNQVTAQVRGSRIKPYSISLRFETWPAEVLRLLYADLRKEPGWKLFLKALELPAGWRARFAQAGLRLLPDPQTMQAVCSCPDWSWPCKHALAVCCELAEKLDQEPLLLLTLQGLDPEWLLQAQPMPEVLETIDIQNFWSGSEVPLLELSLRPETECPLDVLGPLQGIASKVRLKQALGPVYQQSAEFAAGLLSKNMLINED